jgi:spore germination protein KC
MITMEIKTESNLVDQQGTTDLSTPEALRSLGRRHATVVKNEIRAAIDKAREYRADIFGFGEAIGRKFPQEWKELESRWDEAFQELEIESECEIADITGRPDQQAGRAAVSI